MTRIILESINIGAADPLAEAPSGTSGIFKKPVGSGRITVDGVVGDVIVETEHHGGPDQAVYVYARDDYDFWSTELDRELPAGKFSENLTFSTMAADPVRVGDRYRIGDTAVIEVTGPRVPCAKFQAIMGETDWPRRFRKAQRVGYYCRVIAEGDVSDGEAVEREPAPVGNVTSNEILELFFTPNADPERIRRALESPLGIRARTIFEERLSRR